MSRRTIQSPGVEIREIDLKQRPAAAIGTSVFIAGAMIIAAVVIKSLEKTKPVTT